MMDSEINALRKPWETEEMWRLRLPFLERYWSDKGMTKNRLICLSQMLINIEFLGCRYDESLMNKIKEMSEDLVEERQQRRRAVAEQLFGKDALKEEAIKPTYKKRKHDQTDEDQPDKKPKSRAADKTVVNVTTTDPLCAVKMKIFQAIKAELIVMQHQRQSDDALAILNQVCGRAKCRWSIQFDDANKSCYVQIDDVLVTEQVFWGSQTRSRLEACQRVVDLLQRPFFDVRQKATEKSAAPMDNMEMELYTRRDTRSEWEGPTNLRFEPLERAFNNLRKRLASIPRETRNSSAETFLKDAAKMEDLPVEMKRQHLGGWTEEIIISVGKVELHRQQGRIPPKGKEQDSVKECFASAMDFLLKPTLNEGIRVTEESGALIISAKPKSDKSASNQTFNGDFPRKELALKSVRQHLSATNDTVNVVQRIEQSCAKAKIQYEVKFVERGNHFDAVVYVDGVRIGEGTETNKKGAKSKACENTIQRLLSTYIRIRQNLNGEFFLESSNDPIVD